MVVAMAATAVASSPAAAAPTNCSYGPVYWGSNLVGTSGGCSSGTGQHRASLWCLKDGGKQVYGSWKNPGQTSYTDCGSNFWGTPYLASYYGYQVRN
ncbi:hypothetical protein GCM10009827_062590 [Dactylosporangium maewongense]|uniref:Uncharacterized protein n=1 Tax=Dactylosporangium maewongense TaxID=634393 RepID=A0ABN2BBW3_9ACTN